ncbi:GNAT family N-acetyltransferase [Microbacterium sp. zg.Y625]|uniref:GNAT family N-acetyltransferase n=1 Tax=Microbacterium jiangjiandongii TaxID=3049071 RepID=UPI00214A9DE1|nr:MULTISPECIES: GNAT family N-acetyltransferase [unclassified Microbacterium]MCR2792782.1 GNAT family N-acetyltransferase [Microbacterium sp. zg.Y625]WIM26758.1 GNAT family N-acetyltransferase [Microbacterium sp. zg-Y625]
MPIALGGEPLETDRLILRRPHVGDAAVYRELWTERDPRVPAHRRISPEGRPTVEDIAAKMSVVHDESGPRLLTVELRGTADVIGYCGLTVHGIGSPDEPELAYELLRAAHKLGYATEAGQAIVAWASKAGYRRLWAGVWDWNMASRRVLDKLGFREVGRAKPESAHGYTLLTVKDL